MQLCMTHMGCAQLENKNINTKPVPFASYIARMRTPYAQSNSTSPLYYSWNLAGAVSFAAPSTSEARAAQPF